MDIIPFKNIMNDKICGDENDIIKLENTSNDLNNLDENFINVNLCEREQNKLKKSHQPVFIKNEMTGLKLHKKNRLGKRLLFGSSSNEKAKLSPEEIKDHRRKVEVPYKLMKVITTPSSRSERSDYFKENDYRVVPLYSSNNKNNGISCNNRNVIVPYEKIKEFCNVIENHSNHNHKCKNFFIYSPDIIQKWIRVIFNVIITSLIITLIYFVFISVREDINKKIAIQKQNIKEDSISCKKQYEAHKCGTVNLPLLSEKCDEWLKCMKADSNLYQDVSFLSAQMLGQIINAFIVQFEWKSICVIAFIFLLIFIGSNYALSIGGGARATGDFPYSHVPPIPTYPFYPNFPVSPDIYRPFNTMNPLTYNMRYTNVTPRTDPFINPNDYATPVATNNATYEPYYEGPSYEETTFNTHNSQRGSKRKGHHEYTEHMHTSKKKESHINNESRSFKQKFFNLWGGGSKEENIGTSKKL